MLPLVLASLQYFVTGLYDCFPLWRFENQGFFTFRSCDKFGLPVSVSHVIPDLVHWFRCCFQMEMYVTLFP